MGRKGRAWWVTPEGRPIEVHSSHIRVLREQHESFGFTLKQIDAAYHGYRETPLSEGRARADLITDAVKHGWIRVRVYYQRGNEHISLTIDRLNRAGLAEKLRSWATEALSPAERCIPLAVLAVAEAQQTRWDHAKALRDALSTGRSVVPASGGSPRLREEVLPVMLSRIRLNRRDGVFLLDVHKARERGPEAVHKASVSRVLHVVEGSESREASRSLDSAPSPPVTSLAFLPSLLDTDDRDRMKIKRAILRVAGERHHGLPSFWWDPPPGTTPHDTTQSSSPVPPTHWAWATVLTDIRLAQGLRLASTFELGPWLYAGDETEGRLCLLQPSGEITARRDTISPHTIRELWSRARGLPGTDGYGSVYFDCGQPETMLEAMALSLWRKAGGSSYWGFQEG